MENIVKRLMIHGRVQGVWFRDSTRRQALDLGVRGWVKNRPDGSVEVLVEGPEKQVQELVVWCRHGPPSAQVNRVDEIEEVWQDQFHTFDIVF